MLDDQKLDPEEKQFLERLCHDLQLAEVTAAELLRRGTERARSKYIAKSEHYDASFLSSAQAALELTGESDTTIEDAVNAALDDACRAVPDICSLVVYWFEEWDDMDDLFERVTAALTAKPGVWEQIGEMVAAHDDVIWGAVTEPGEM